MHFRPELDDHDLPFPYRQWRCDSSRTALLEPNDCAELGTHVSNHLFGVEDFIAFCGFCFLGLKVVCHMICDLMGTRKSKFPRNATFGVDPFAYLNIPSWITILPVWRLSSRQDWQWLRLDEHLLSFVQRAGCYWCKVHQSPGEPVEWQACRLSCSATQGESPPRELSPVGRVTYKCTKITDPWLTGILGQGGGAVASD